MTGPQPYRCPLGRLLPQSPDIDQIKQEAWNRHAILVVHRDNPRLSQVERQQIMTLGRKLYGQPS